MVESRYAHCAISACDATPRSERIAFRTNTCMTMYQMPNIVPGSQNASRPFHANGPVLKKGNRDPGTNVSAPHKLNDPAQRGKTGLRSECLKIARPQMII